MRKILLATTALVGFAVSAAQAAPAPLTVTVGGSVDAIAGAFHESRTTASDDFETLYTLNFGVAGKTGSGIEYGGALMLDNTPDIANGFLGAGNGVEVTTADVFMSGAFGKVVAGDSRGATDLNVGTPVVGEGQVEGRFIDFLNGAAYAKNFVAGIDGTEHSTNITYFTPKVGNDTNKVQLGVTFEPNMYNYGSNVVQGTTDALSPYRNVIKGAVAYTGTFKPVSVGLSANIINGSTKAGTTHPTWIVGAPAGEVQDFTAFGVGAQAAAEGFTLGGTFTNLGSYNTVAGQSRDQHVYSAGLKYEISKVGVGVSYLGGEGYDNLLTAGSVAKNNADYVKVFDNYGIGGAYTWAPGLTTNVDGIMFDQKTANTVKGVKDDGYVLLLSQKLAF